MAGPADGRGPGGRGLGGRGPGKREEPVIRGALRSLRREIPGDNLGMAAAALAYHGIFGLLPALAAAAALWGQFGDFSVLDRLADRTGSVLPPGSVALVKQFVTGVPEGFGGGLGLAVNLGLATFIAFRAARSLLIALNVVYESADGRGLLRRSLVALAVGVCGIALLFVALAVVALPPALGAHLGSGVAVGLLWLRWPALMLLFTAAVGLLFRFGPNRRPPRGHWVGWGALAAALLWLTASAGVSFYVANLASFGRLYGSLGSVAVVLLWFYVSAYAVLIGAEIDAYLAVRAQGRSPGWGDRGGGGSAPA